MPAPLPAGAVQSTRTIALPNATFGAAGATGAPILTGAEATENGPKPSALCARTLNVYDVAFFRPVKISVTLVLLYTCVTLATVPMNALTLYELIGLPWFAGAFHVTRAFRLIGDATGLAGAAGVDTAAPAGAIGAVSP